MREQVSYVVRVWDGDGIPSHERWMAERDDAISYARTTSRHQSCTTTVFYDGYVIARFDDRAGPKPSDGREHRTF